MDDGWLFFAVFDQSWPFWPFLAIFARFCLSLPTFGHFCQFLGVFGHILPVFAHFAYICLFCPFLPIFAHFWPFLAVSSSFCPFLPILPVELQQGGGSAPAACAAGLFKDRLGINMQITHFLLTISCLPATHARFFLAGGIKVLF